MSVEVVSRTQCRRETPEPGGRSSVDVGHREVAWPPVAGGMKILALPFAAKPAGPKRPLGAPAPSSVLHVHGGETKNSVLPSAAKPAGSRGRSAPVHRA